MINVYYTIMSIYGWILWSASSEDNIHVEVSWANFKQWIFATVLFVFSLGLVTVIYYYKPAIDNHFSTENVNFLEVLRTFIQFFNRDGRFPQIIALKDYHFLFVFLRIFKFLIPRLFSKRNLYL